LKSAPKDKPEEEKPKDGKSEAAEGKKSASSKPAELQKFADIREFADSRQFSVQSPEAFAFYNSRYPKQVKMDPGATYNAHEYSALARSLCAAEVLRIEGLRLKKMEVLDYFGAPRNFSLIPNPKSGVSIDWTLGPNTCVEGDQARNARWLRKDIPHGQMFDTVIVQDVYQEGEGPYTALSAKTILELAGRTRSGNVYVMARMFVGEAGCDDYGDGRREQVWYRKDKFIISSPEQGVPPYPAHPDVNWLLSRHTDGLDVAVLRIVGPYHLFRCSAAIPGSQAIGIEVEIEPAVSRIRISCARTWVQKLIDYTIRPVMERVLAVVPESMRPEEAAPPVFCVHVKAAEAAGDKYLLKPPYGTILDAASVAVESALAKDHLAICLRERFPSFYNRMRLDTTMAVVYAGRENISTRLLHLRTDFVPSEKDLANARSTSLPFEASYLPISLKAAAIGLGAAAGLLFLRHHLRIRAAGSLGTAVAGVVSTYPKMRAPLEWLGGGIPLELWLGYPGVAINLWASAQFCKLSYAFVMAREVIPMCIQQGRAIASEIVRKMPQLTVPPICGDFPSPSLGQVSLTLMRLRQNYSSHPIAVLHELAVPFYEELLWKMFPRFGDAMFFMEFIGHWTFLGLWPALMTAAMHRVCRWIHIHFSAKGQPLDGYMLATALHFFWNMRATPFTAEGFVPSPSVNQPRPTWQGPVPSYRVSGSVAQAFTRFIEAYVLGERIEPRSLWSAIPAATTIPSFSSKITCGPEVFRGTVAIRIDGRKVELEEALAILSDPTPEPGSGAAGRNVLHPILVTNGLLWMPARNSLNTLVACVHRIHNDPFTKCDPPHIIEERWRETAKMMIESGMFSGTVHEVRSLEQCCQDMGPKGARILAAYLQDVAGAKFPMKMEIMLKWNETITAQKLFHNGQVTLKPRAIVNLDPILHANMAQLSRALNAYLHQIFVATNVWRVGDKSMIIIYASGSTQEALSTAGAVMFQGQADLVVIVSGDDSAYNWFGKLGEADQSAFDHTQSTGAIDVAAVMWLEHLGVPREFIDLLLFCSRIRYKIRHERLEVIGDGGTQLPTGFMCTTSLSSVDCIFMYVRWLHRVQLRPTITLVEVGEELGFTVKDQRRDSAHQLTFLKGWWTVNARTRAPLWMPLPSAVLKLGKLLRSPREICRVQNNGKWSQPPIERAIAQVAVAIALSYGNVPEAYPVLGAFLWKLRRLGYGVLGQGPDKYRTISFNAVNESAWYKTRVDDGCVDIEMAREAVCYRYDLQPRDLQRVEDLLSRINTLPAYIEDPVFNRLVEVDYQ